MRHCHVRHRQACSQRAKPCMPYRWAGPGPRTDWEAERQCALPAQTRARSATSLDPQHGVVVMETWRQCIRSIKVEQGPHLSQDANSFHYLIATFRRTWGTRCRPPPTSSRSCVSARCAAPTWACRTTTAGSPTTSEASSIWASSRSGRSSSGWWWVRRWKCQTLNLNLSVWIYYYATVTPSRKSPFS